MKKKNNITIIMGIESSCDETGISIIKKRTILSNVIIHQPIHKKYGGVVPELSSRLHEKNLPIAFENAIKYAKINKKQIHGVSCTIGPGLIGSLLVGMSFAKSISIGLNIPLLTVNHIQAHVLTHFIKESNTCNKKINPKFPFLCLMISGGHTQIIQVNDFFSMNIIGTTLDDAIGDTLDKIARIFGLQYPGGPLIEKFSKFGDPNKFFFPKPLVSKLNFSFSGIKSYVNRFINNKLYKDPNFIKKNINDLCASIQKTMAEILIEKILQAVSYTGITSIALSGGVSSNSIIRNMFLDLKKNNKSYKIFFTNKEYSTDNGAMIAITGVLKYERNLFDKINVHPYAKMQDLNTITY